MGIRKKYRLVTENNFGTGDILFSPNQALRQNIGSTVRSSADPREATIASALTDTAAESSLPPTRINPSGLDVESELLVNGTDHKDAPLRPDPEDWDEVNWSDTIGQNTAGEFANPDSQTGQYYDALRGNPIDEFTPDNELRKDPEDWDEANWSDTIGQNNAGEFANPDSQTGQYYDALRGNPIDEFTPDNELRKDPEDWDEANWSDTIGQNNAGEFANPGSQTGQYYDALRGNFIDEFTPNQELRKDLRDIQDDYPTRDADFLLRAGTLQRQNQDVERISNYLLSADGLLFTAKQNLLSRSGVKTEASGIINEGPYLPDNTILQVSQAGIGGHAPKNGLDNGIVGGIASLVGLDVPGKLPQYTEAVDNTQLSESNRLVQLLGGKIHSSDDGPTRFERAIDALNGTDGTGLLGRIGNAANILLQTGELVSPDPNEILRYGGGPGSVAGVGETVIGRYSNTSLEAQIAYNPKIAEQLGIESPQNPEDTPTNDVFDSGILEQFQSVTGVDINPGKIRDGVRTSGKLFARNQQLGNSFKGTLGPSINPDDVEESPNPEASPDSERPQLSREQLDAKGEESLQTRHQIKRDFRTGLDPDNRFPKIFGGPLFNDPAKAQIDTRINHGIPGDNRRGQDGTSVGALDKINYMPLYRSTGATGNTVKNDLVKFRIAAIDTETPSQSVYIHFRAFLESFNESYTAEWQGRRYMGRGEEFYKYSGFGRTVSLSWKVAAQSRPELIQMYTKLNFLASNLAPDYTTSGYMGGPLVRLTVGGYLFEQHGFISSLNLTIPENSPWELGISPSGSNNTDIGATREENDNVKELPLYLDASMEFTPIHSFVPEKQKNKYEADNNVVSEFGLQRYIALSNSRATDGDNNYKTSAGNPLVAEENIVRNVGRVANDDGSGGGNPLITSRGIITQTLDVPQQQPSSLLRQQAAVPKTRREMRQERRRLRTENRRLIRG